MDDALLEPVDLYIKKLEKEFHDNAGEYFDEITKNAKVNVEANKATVKEYKHVLILLEKARNQLGKTRALKGFLIFLVVLLFLACGLFIYFAIADILVEMFVAIIISVCCLAGAIGFIVLLVKRIKHKLKKQEETVSILEQKANQLLSEAYAQMAPLNALFDWNMHVELFKRTTPLIKVDKYFDVTKFNYMHHKYGLTDQNDENISTDLILSGEIVGNPFLLVRQLKQDWGTHTYHGSLTISWVETYRDSDGHVKTTTRTQTLHASLVKPIPTYEFNTFLIYGNDAASELTFSRNPSGASGKSEREIARMVRKGEKILNKLAEETLMDDKPGTFTKLANTEFDYLFGALDRDNDVQFRLLFTPLAQKSMLQLIKGNYPYGDDFSFRKENEINYIYSEHSQTHDYTGNPINYISYDWEASKSQFVSYNDNFFRGLYFDLAPLLCIPLYQQHMPDEHIFQHTYERNYTSYESEVMANAFDVNLFRHPDAITNTILKANFAGKCGKADQIAVCAHSYTGIDHVDYVSVYGGDGHYHQVPVHWVEYIPVQMETMMAVREYEGSRKDFNDASNDASFQSFMGKYVKDQKVIYQRNLMAFIMGTYYSENQEQELTSILTKYKK